MYEKFGIPQKFTLYCILWSYRVKAEFKSVPQKSYFKISSYFLLLPSSAISKWNWKGTPFKPIFTLLRTWTTNHYKQDHLEWTGNPIFLRVETECYFALWTYYFKFCKFEPSFNVSFLTDQKYFQPKIISSVKHEKLKHYGVYKLFFYNFDFVKVNSEFQFQYEYRSGRFNLHEVITLQ